MKALVLFSGGKDCGLSAVMVSKFFQTELITYSFGLLDNYKQAEKAAKILKMPFNVAKLDKEILDNAVEITLKDGFPNNGIKYIHQRALESASQNVKIIADGIRRDDRVPVLSLPEIRSLEDKFGVHYIQPLMGFSRKTINLLADKFFDIKEYKSVVQ